MNVIVSNRQKDIIDNANIDAIKDLNGLFNVDDLINKFKNYFFSKMILDATSVVNFASKPVLTTLAEEIGAEKLIILLPSNPEPPVEFKKLLIELKIYNFTNNINDVVRFIDNPNTYEDAMKLIDGSYDSDMYVDNSIKDNDDDDGNNNNEEYQEEPKEEIREEVNENNEPLNSFGGHTSLGDMLSTFNVHNSSEETNNEEEYNEPSFNDNSGSVFDNIGGNTVDFNNQEFNTNYDTNNFEANKEENNVENKNTFLITDGFDDVSYNSEPKTDKLVIGFKDVTMYAGSTTLIYMLHRVLANTLKKNVLSIEIGKNDFRLLRESKMISVEEKDVKEVIENAKEDVVFVDLNNYNGEDLCNDVLYLIEPSTIMLNRLMANNRNVFKELKGKKVLLNKSLLSPNDVRTLSNEAGIEFFCNIGPLNDRIMNDSIAELINLLGIK